MQLVATIFEGIALESQEINKYWILWADVSLIV